MNSHPSTNGPLEQQTRTAPGGRQVAVYRYVPEHVSSETALVLVHGHGEHMGRYQDFARELAVLGLPIVGYDHRGHGKTDGPRGDAAGIEQLADDLDALLPLLLKEANAERAILLGHSMGGLVTATWITRGHHPGLVRGAILSAPYFRVPPRLDIRVKVAVGKLIAQILPTMIFSTGLDATGISRSQEQVQKYNADPLVHNKVSARFGKSLVDDPNVVIRRAHQAKIPLFVYHGTADRIASIEGTRDFVRGLPRHLVTFKELEGFYHEPHHEPEADARQVHDLVRAQINNWLNQPAPEWASPQEATA